MAFSLQRSVKKIPEFNVSLLEIANEITHDVLEDMKFVCDFPKGKLESINKPREFLGILQTSGKIAPGDVDYLVSLLEKVGSEALAKTVVEKLGGSASSDARNVNNLPLVTTHFTGREEVVDRIIKKLTQESSPLRMIVITSIPGVGKTQVAIQVSRNLHRLGRPVIFIEEIGKQDNLANVCGEILRRVSGSRLSERHDLVAVAKRRLKELQGNVVIVLDNTEDIQGKEFDEFAEYLVKYAPAVQLIITTREDVGFNSLNVHKERLEPLDLDSSFKLLQESVDICGDRAMELCELCGGIPLLLVHCACLLRESFSPEVLIGELRQNPIRFLSKTDEDVYNTLGRFLRKISKGLLENIVRVSVFPSAFSAKDIGFLFNDSLELQTVKAKMVKHSLLQEVKNDVVALHPLVREYCRAEGNILGMEDVGDAAQHKFNCYYLELLQRLSKQFICKDSALGAISSFRKLRANIMEALSNCLKEKSSTEDKAVGVDVANSTEVLDFLSKVLSPPAECTKLYQRCCNIAKASGDYSRHADSLNSLGFRRLCDVAHRKGDRRTLDMFQQAYDLRMTLPEEQQKCETHAHTVCKLGTCYSLEGKLEKGLALIQEGIAMRKSLGGRVRLYVAAGYCDLGNAYRHCGDHQNAIDIWEKETYEVYRTELGDHPWTASILRYIANSYKALADRSSEPETVNKAFEYSTKALELRIKLLGVHQDTARSHVDLSDILEIKKEFPSALRELEKALEIQNDVLGDNHETTMNTREKMVRISAMIKMGN